MSLNLDDLGIDLSYVMSHNERLNTEIKEIRDWRAAEALRKQEAERAYYNRPVIVVPYGCRESDFITCEADRAKYRFEYQGSPIESWFFLGDNCKNKRDTLLYFQQLEREEQRQKEREAYEAERSPDRLLRHINQLEYQVQKLSEKLNERD